MAARFDRAGLLVLASGAVLGSLAPGAAADAVPAGDLAYLRLLIATELLAADFQDTALAGGKLSARSTRVLKQMRADEDAHYRGLAALMNGLGQTPASADDIDFSYPSGSFASEGSIVKLAAELEDLSLGAYLGAVENVQTPQLRLPIGQIAANEAQHVSALAPWSGRSAIGPAFGPSLQIAAVSAALDTYES
jgi:hypothetical protein